LNLEKHDGIGTLVSIVSPTYNQGRYIERAIQSVTNQTYSNWELIIVDGESTDETHAVLKRYEKQTRQVIAKGNEAEASNHGFRLSRGEIIGWLSTDDYYESDAFEFAVDYFLKHPDVAMIYGDYRRVDSSGRELKVCNLPDFDLGNLLHRGGSYIVTPALFFRRAVIDEIGYLDETLKYSCDYDYWIRLGSKFCIRHVPKILANYRVHPQALTAQGLRVGDMIKEAALVRKRYLSDPSLADILAIRFYDFLHIAYVLRERGRALVGKSHRLTESQS
jgi:glycosyltransferase involved in cell wall biosynthesis